MASRTTSVPPRGNASPGRSTRRDGTPRRPAAKRLVPLRHRDTVRQDLAKPRNEPIVVVRIAYAADTMQAARHRDELAVIDGICFRELRIRRISQAPLEQGERLRAKPLLFISTVIRAKRLQNEIEIFFDGWIFGAELKRSSDRILGFDQTPEAQFHDTQHVPGIMGPRRFREHLAIKCAGARQRAGSLLTQRALHHPSERHPIGFAERGPVLA